MGISRPVKTEKIELEELIQSLLKCASVYDTKKGNDDFKFDLELEQHPPLREKNKIIEEEQEEKLVCVTSGASFLGLAIVHRLLSRGYSVRITVDNEGDLEKLRETEIFKQRREGVNGVTAITANMTDVESLCEAFRGCHGVFHTSSFADPAGVAGYTALEEEKNVICILKKIQKFIADLEVRASENVMEACLRTESVRKCVLTSSLLACVWRDNSSRDLPPIINDECWSDESVCRDKKLWFALGKTMAEKAAWRMAEGGKVKLATICPGLLTGPDFVDQNPTSSIAYMKGAQEMYVRGLLATSDVNQVVEANVCVYEAMRNTAFGRYICFDRVIGSEEEVVELASQMGLPVHRISNNSPSDSSRFKLCNRKLSRLMYKQSKCY